MLLLNVTYVTQLIKLPAKQKKDALSERLLFYLSGAKR